MRKKTVRRSGVILFAVFFSLLVSYMGLAEYYKNGFSYGTWINGIYCTGKTVEEVNEELLKNCSYAGLTIYDGEGNVFRIKPEDVGYAFDFREALQAYLDRQNSYLWIDNLFMAKEMTLLPVISYDEGRLREVLESVPAFGGKSQEERTVSIQKTDAGYLLVDERKHVLNEERASEAVREKLFSLETRLDLEESGCYEDLPYTEAMEAELDKWEKISRFQDCRIVYEFGKELVPIDASIVCDWMALDENGEFLYDEAGNIKPDDGKIEAFIDELAAEYDTVGAIRYFNATRGETVAIEGGIYGNRIDEKAEKEYLKQAFARKAEEIHTPQYIQKGWEQGKDDIGDTYIEVDMAEQMMYYYQEGKLELETPIVTGNTGRRWGTPEGVNYIYGKARNRVLRGQGYESHVNFWMPVKGNIGIHDAAWRSEYGGEIYKTNGSHGCINTPYEAMGKLYDMAEIGTPVVMFY
ncbi:hypothetical protein D3Z45_02580 [Lachnospiraceae bacterium]|nr:hypothetical protein [Lachnospiraceae bacterium]